MVTSGVCQTIVRSFDGDKGVAFSDCQPDKTRCGRQPESNVAANGSVVVQVTWQNLRVYDYSGKLLRSTPMSEFVKKAGLDSEPKAGKGPFEPHVIYDEFRSEKPARLRLQRKVAPLHADVRVREEGRTRFRAEGRQGPLRAARDLRRI